MEKKKNNKSVVKVICFSLLVVLFGVSLCLNVYQYVSNKDSDEVAVEDSLVVDDDSENILSSDAKNISLEMSIGDSYNFKEILDNSNYSESIENFDESKFTLKYNSDSKVVSVTDKGVFTGVASGETTIYAIYDKVEYAVSISIKEVETSNATTVRDFGVYPTSYALYGKYSVKVDSKYIKVYLNSNTKKMFKYIRPNIVATYVSKDYKKVFEKKKLDYIYSDKSCGDQSEACILIDKKNITYSNDVYVFIDITSSGSFSNEKFATEYEFGLLIKRTDNGELKYLTVQPPRIHMVGFDQNKNLVIVLKSPTTVINENSLYNSYIEIRGIKFSVSDIVKNISFSNSKMYAILVIPSSKLKLVDNEHYGISFGYNISSNKNSYLKNSSYVLVNKSPKYKKISIRENFLNK